MMRAKHMSHAQSTPRGFTALKRSVREFLNMGFDASNPISSFRKRFILQSMFFASIVLVIVVTSVGLMSYRHDMLAIDQALDHRVDIPVGPKEMEGKGKFAGGRDVSGDQFVATSLYVETDEGASTMVENVLDLDEEVSSEAIQAAKEALSESEEGSAGGFLNELNLYYRVLQDGPQTRIAFASGNYLLQGTGKLVFNLTVASVIALVAFFVASLFFARRATAPVKQAWEEQQRFIADASHELKTPLTVIMANNSIIASMPDSRVSEQQQWLESSQIEAEQMQSLINDMLYLARVEHHDDALLASVVDMSEIVAHSVLQFESVAFEQGVTITYDAPEKIWVKGDSSSLNRLVATLVDNACKYAGSEGVVTVSLEATQKVCRFTVHNTGSYIAAEDLPRLFDRFYRADKARTSGAGGFGLGLSIAQGIAEAHGGSIRAHSAPGEGTSFIVEIPLSR